MKRSFYKISLCLFAFLFAVSCQKDEVNNEQELSTSEVVFSFNTKNEGLKNAADISDAHAIVLSIENSDGTTVHSNLHLELLNMNGNFITSPISLTIGNYKITHFVVTDAENNAIYATPIEGSTKAYLVSDPLPIEFNLQKDEVKNLSPEVLDVNDLTPEDFGYTTFNFTEVKTFDFLVSVMGYNSEINNYELLSANLSVTTNENSLYSGNLEALTNQITLNDGYEEYNLNVTKEGYKPYAASFTNSELKSYFNSEDNGPLIVILEKGDTHNTISFKITPANNDNDFISCIFPPSQEFYIDWGDESPIEQTYSHAPSKHVYNSNNEYTVTISGNISEINGLRLYMEGIHDLEITNAVNLTQLELCYGELITNIDLSIFEKLRFFIIENTPMSLIDVSELTNLEQLTIRKSVNINSIDVSKNQSLTYLNITECSLTSVDLTHNLNLEAITLHKNQIENIKVNHLTKLTQLQLGYNPITNIDISNLTELITLRIHNCLFTELDVSNNTKLVWLDVNGCKISTLDISNFTEISWVWASHNNMTDIILPESFNNISGVIIHANNFPSSKIDEFATKVLASVSANPQKGTFRTSNEPGTDGETAINSLVNDYEWTYYFY